MTAVVKTVLCPCVRAYNLKHFVAAQDVAAQFGVPPGVTIGSFDALAAYNSPNATLAALGRAVYTIEASITNLVSLGVAFLFRPGNSPVDLANIMFIVRRRGMRS